MHFVVYGVDRADAGSLRTETRAAHLSYLSEFEVIFGGPLLADEGEMCGSLVVVELEDLKAAEAFAAVDPYSLAGLFERVDITGFKPVIGI